VLKNVDPAARRGPALQIPSGAVSLRHRLRGLRDQLVAEDTREGSRQPPEVIFNKSGVQTDVIVEALLVGQVVYRDALYAAQTEELQVIVDQAFFNSVWGVIAQFGGLIIVSAD
jgi:hypothetical protein